MAADEDGPQLIPEVGRFHVTPDHRLFVIYYVQGTDAAGDTVSENRIMELLGNGKISEPVRVPLQTPFTSFFTATPRGGSPLSRTIELLGTQAGKGDAIGYARILLK